MSISLEKIDLIMERANVSYKEAKETLERTDGDLLEALIILEKGQKTVGQEQAKKHEEMKAKQEEMKEKGKSIFKCLKETRFQIQGKEKKVLDVSLITASVVTVITMPVSIFVLAVPYLFGHKIVIKKPQDRKSQESKESQATEPVQ